jgi:hypothetical protein
MKIAEKIRPALITAMCLFGAGIVFSPADCRATTVSISATVNSDGSVEITADSSFPECPPNEYGQYRSYRHFLMTPGGGDACNDSTAGTTATGSCTYPTDRSFWHGSHTFTALAQGCPTSNEATASYTLVLDNTPKIVMNEPGEKVTSSFNVSGSVQFTPTREGLFGDLSVYINGSYVWSQGCFTADCNFSVPVSRGVGPHRLIISANGRGVIATKQQPFVVCDPSIDPCCPLTDCCNSPDPYCGVIGNSCE